MLIISVVFCYLSEKVENKKAKIFLQILSALPFFIVSAIRYDVGTDYLTRYAGEHQKMLIGKPITNLEIGYRILLKICVLISESPNLLFAITSAIIICSIFFIIFKSSKNKALSIFIFFAGCFFFQSLNIMRQYIAVCMVIIFYQLLVDKKYKYMIIPMSIAVLMHTTSIVAIIAIGLTKKVIAKPQMIFAIMLIIILLSGVFNDIVGLVDLQYIWRMNLTSRT